MTQGGLNSLLTLNADYNLPYQYAMLVMTWLPLDKLHAIKLFSILFDFILAYYVFKLVWEITKNNFNSFMAGSVALLIPTVVINSSAWGQSDGIYTALLLATIYYIIKEKPSMAMLMYTLSFGFKIQAIFLGPIMAIFLFKKFFKLKHLLIPAGVYVLLSLPIVAIGGSFTRIIDIAMKQINIREGFSFYLPNFFYIFNANALLEYSTWVKPFIAMFVIIIAGLSFVAYQKIKTDSPRNILVWSAIFAFLCPFFLVRMHERYYFPAIILLLVLSFIDKGKFFKSLLTTEVISLLAYTTVLWWVVAPTDMTIPRIMTRFAYPFMSILVIAVFMLSIYQEFKRSPTCYIEPTN